jgi:hypothetical protein
MTKDFDAVERVSADDGCIIFDPDGAQNYPATAAVEVLLGGVGRVVFPDGSEQFFDEGDEEGEGFVYSPRLQPDALELFCRENMERYDAFNKKHAAAINRFEQVPMPHFWDKSASPETI